MILSDVVFVYNYQYLIINMVIMSAVNMCVTYITL